MAKFEGIYNHNRDPGELESNASTASNENGAQDQSKLYIISSDALHPDIGHSLNGRWQDRPALITCAGSVSLGTSRNRYRPSK